MSEPGVADGVASTGEYLSPAFNVGEVLRHPEVRQGINRFKEWFGDQPGQELGIKLSGTGYLVGIREASPGDITVWTMGIDKLIGNSDSILDPHIQKYSKIPLIWAGRRGTFPDDIRSELANYKKLGKLSDAQIQEQFPNDPQMLEEVHLYQQTLGIVISRDSSSGIGRVGMIGDIYHPQSI